MSHHQQNTSLYRTVLDRSSIPLVLTFATGLVLSVAAAVILQHWDDERIRLAFEQDAYDSIMAVQQSVQHHSGEIRATGSLYKASREVDRVEFRAFTHDILRNSPGTQALEWVPRIAGDEREEHINTVRQDFPAYQITERASHGELVPAAERHIHYPVTFLEPYKGNENALGFDLGSNPARLDALHKARDSGELVASSRLMLVQETGKQAGVLFILPVYHNNMPIKTLEQRRKNLGGYIVGVFRIADLINTSLVHRNNQHVKLQIHDKSSLGAEKRLLYSQTSDKQKGTGRNKSSVNNLNIGINLMVGGRKWLINATGKPEYYTGTSSWNGLLAFLIGLLFSALLTAYLSNNLDRTKKIKQLVNRRTRELKKSQLILENEIAEHKRTDRQLSEREDALTRQHGLLSAISTAQSRFIRDADVMALFDKLLLDILSISDSEYGFIGEVLYRDGNPYLKTLAISNIAWSAETEKFYAENAPEGLEFTNLDSLFGAAIKSGDTVITNDPATDSRRGGLPPGHPPLNAFLGIPFYRGQKVIGMFGIANRASGYDQALVDFLDPITATCTQIVEALKADRQRQHAEEQLRERETRMRTLFENVVDGIITTSDQGIIESFNRAAENMFGYSADEVIGKNVSMLTPMPHRNKHDKYISDYLDGRESRIMGAGREVQGVRKDGSTFPADIAITEMWAGDERIFCSIMRDITERKKVERMKNEFISTVSHELRTPLTSIRGALGLVGSGTAGELPATAQPLVDIAAKNCDRLVRLINDILDIEKIEANKMEFTIQPIELAQLVNHAVESNEAYAGEYGVDIVASDEAPGTVVAVDEDRFTQVMTNLLSNAAKFSPRGGTIRVATQFRDDFVRVSVSDNGPGIPEAFQKQIFEKFSQADGSDTRQKGGTGLGLSITRSIVEKLGGRITFETQEGKGTTFHVDVPVHDEPVDATPGIADGQPATASTAARILVCEDEADVAHLLRLMLQARGYTVDIASSATEAETMLAEHEYSAMTLDLMLPDKYGIDLFRDIRENEKTRELPVTIVSAVADTEAHRLSGDAIEVIDWIGKPIDEHKLISAITRSVSQATAAKHRILHVEDETDVREIINTMVGDRYHLSSARTLAEAKRRLVHEKFDLIILDLGLPDGSGVSLLPMLARQIPRVPVVLFSGREIDADIAREVDAVLVKSMTSNEILIDTIQTTIASQARLAREA